MARRQQTKFVGTVYLRDGDPRVRLDGAMFSHSVRVGDLTAKGASISLIDQPAGFEDLGGSSKRIVQSLGKKVSSSTVLVIG